MSSTASDVDVSTLIKQLKAIQDAPPEDKATRQELADTARALALSLEGSGETIERIVHSPLQTVMGRIASDLSLFEILVDKDGSSSTAELAKVTKTDEVFLGRLLRYLASFGMIREAGEDRWSASNISKTLSVPGLKGGLTHFHDVIMPCWQALPGFLAETKYQNPSDSAHSPFQKGHNTDLGAFPFLQKTPHFLHNFNLWMTANHEGQNLFLDGFPFEKEVATTSNPETALFVDVGGGFGHQCNALRARLPNVPGRVILEDLPAVVARATPAEGVEVLGHDFMKEQPIQGAKAYYMRNVLHDWPDDTCVTILQHVMKAMGDDSVILIDDMVVPSRGAHWRITQLDVTMLSATAAIERTEKQWRSLMEKAGLKVRQIYTYTPVLRDSIIVAVPK